MTKWQTESMGVGVRAQSGAPPVNGRGRDSFEFFGVVRGVVLAVFVSDGEEAFPSGMQARRAHVYADCLVYSSRPGFRGTVLKRVSCGDGGLHDGRLWKPRATTGTISGRPLDGHTDDPMDLDGDHLLIAFVDGDMGSPTMLRRIDHPQRGIGNDDADRAGFRDTLKLADGQPDLWKHRGSFLGFNDSGDVVVDTRRAHGVTNAAKGVEDPSDDASHGNVVVNVGQANTVTITSMAADGTGKKFQLVLRDNEIEVKLQDGASFKVSGKDANAIATIGTGTHSVAVVEQLQAYVELLRGWAAAHTHIDGFGSTAPSPLPVPPWDPTINSTHVKIPGG